MPHKPMTREQCLEAIHAVNAAVAEGFEIDTPRGKRGAYGAAGEALGLQQSSLRHRITVAKDRFGLTPDNVGKPERIGLDDDEDRPDPIAVMNRHQQANTDYIQKNKRKPVVIPVKPEPFAIAYVGDPHLSNKGCNLVAFRQDMELLRATGVRAIQMGDVLDNFHKIAKLAHNEAHNRMTISEAMSVAKWAIMESGVKWDAHILGNHDLWLGDEGVMLFKEWVRQARSRMFDWNCEIIYHWESGHHRVAAAHDMKGHSQYNPLHGPGKMALIDGQADTYVAAHRHNHALMEQPNGYRNKTYNLVRVRGYKDFDSYAAGRAQFPNHEGMEGRSAIEVVNPLAETHSGKSKVFMDIAEGLEYLQALKRRWS